MTEPASRWITPFTKQCWVTAGVSLNMMGHGLVLGYAAVLLPQLRAAHSTIHVDDELGSWIASIVGISLVAGAFLAPTVAGAYGRRAGNAASVAPLAAGWVLLATAQGAPDLLAARVLHGVAMGMSATLSPISIGEYTSPADRGAFLATISLAIGSGVLFVHSLGAFLDWRTTALVCLFVAFLDFLIIYHSPESPAWLARVGRHEESRRAYRWLRGRSEDDELERMIEAVLLDDCTEKCNKKKSLAARVCGAANDALAAARTKEFYKPLIIMIHLYFLNQWSGANVLAAYATDVLHNVVGDEANVSLLVITMGVQRLISNACAVYVIRRVRRRRMLLVTVTLNVCAFLSLAAYSYCRSRGLLPTAARHPLVGTVLVHAHVFSIATGTVPLPNVLAGELFPLRYRGVGGGISVVFLSANLFATVKTAPPLFSRAGLHGAYCLYAAVVAYCLLFLYLTLPETKDRTLQEIEDEFRGRPATADEARVARMALSLTSLELRTLDRRCSSPALF